MPDHLQELINVVESISDETEDPENSCAIAWSPKVGYIFRSPPYPQGQPVPEEMVALAACFVRLDDPEWRQDMVKWYVKNRN